MTASSLIESVTFFSICVEVTSNVSRDRLYADGPTLKDASDRHATYDVHERFENSTLAHRPDCAR